jgi:hypothetical protein
MVQRVVSKDKRDGNDRKDIAIDCSRIFAVVWGS